MGNRYIFAGFIFLIMTVCGGCSGSGTAGSSRVTVSFGQTAKASKTVFAGSTTATSGGGLPSIVKKVTITVTAPDITTITRVINIAPGQSVVADSFTVPNGTGRVFTVIAEDNYNNTPYKGTATADLSGTAVSLPIAMVEDVNAAITARLYLYFKDTIEAKGAALTVADLDPFYATVKFGINNGQDRTGTVSFETNDYKRGFLAKGMTALTVTATPSAASAGQYIVTGKGTFTDGSFGFPDDGFVMVKENGEWKITGNNYRAKIDLRGMATQWIAGPTSQRVETGLLVRVEDRGNLGLLSAVVTGPGLPTGGIVLAQDPLFPQMLKLGNTYQATPILPTMQNEMYVMSDATLSGITGKPVYTTNIYDSNNVMVEQRTFTLPTRPWLRSELTAAHFPAFSGTPPISPVSAATDGHYLADARVGGTLGYRVGLPTAFAPSWFDTALNFYGWDTLGKNGFYLNQDLLLTDTSASLITAPIMPEVALGGSVSLNAEDFDNKRKIMTVWLFNGPVATTSVSSIISFMTSTIQVPNGVTSPATAAVWRYGGAAPVVTWGGSLLSSPAVEIFLLADDPQRVATSAGFGDPFPGSRWVRLTPTAVSGASGSFTLTAPVETLGIAGRGCRIMVVSILGDYWALTQQFTISP